MYTSSSAGVYTLVSPVEPSPLVFSSPHSGRDYPPDFVHDCPRDILEESVDHFVDELCARVPQHGAFLLAALFPRTYIDPNRAADDIDPALLKSPWTCAMAPTQHTQAGIGLIHRLAGQGHWIYNRKLSCAEITHRLDSFYHPYHEVLESVVARAQALSPSGRVWHLDCHAMPAARKNAAQDRIPRLMPDFVLGDRDGTTCEAALLYTVRDFLIARGFVVTINTPYKGLEILKRYGNPAQDRHSLQIEINKSLYLTQAYRKKEKDFEKITQTITDMAKHLSEFLREDPS